jgi:hypothetical protein
MARDARGCLYHPALDYRITQKSWEPGRVGEGQLTALQAVVLPNVRKTGGLKEGHYRWRLKTRTVGAAGRVRRSHVRLDGAEAVEAFHEIATSWNVFMLEGCPSPIGQRFCKNVETHKGNLVPGIVHRFVIVRRVPIGSNDTCRGPPHRLHFDGIVRKDYRLTRFEVCRKRRSQVGIPPFAPTMKSNADRLRLVS